MLITGSGFPPAVRTTQGKVLSSPPDKHARVGAPPLIVVSENGKELFAEHHAKFAFHAFF
jgi:hypothetical protein